MAFLQKDSMSDRRPLEASQAPLAPPPSSESQPLISSQRSRRQLGLFFAGAGFFAVTSLITRRSLVRRYKATVPKFYQPSNQANYEVNGAVEALEALNIATINVLSISMMVGSGLLYAFDISSLEDLRRYIGKRLGSGGPKTDQDAEKEIEEWIIRTFNLGAKEGRREEEPKKAEGASEILARLSKLEEEKKSTKPNGREQK